MSPSCLGSTTLSIVILLLVQHFTSDITASETLSELQLISDLIDDNADQSRNYTSKEDDQKMVRDDQSGSEESTNIMDPDWVAEWRRKMEVYSSWLDHFSNSYFNPRPNTFTRKSRGRIDRMPLSYGKRSVRSETNKDVADSSNFDAAERQQGIALESGSDGLPSEVKDLYTRIRKGRLSRMPLTFGKRVPDDGTARGFFTRLPKGRIDRMPLTFGKRGESVLLDGYFERTSKGSLDRMPLTFGKRNGQDFINRADEKTSFTSLTSESISETDANNEKETMGQQVDEDGLYSRFSRGRLGRMPAMFGKRQPNDMLDSAGETSYFSRLPKSRIDRMPAMFGKRQDEEVQNNSEENNVFSRDAKSRLGRMPAMFGKREDEISNDMEENNIFSRDAKSRLGRMPAMFGKREDEEMLNDSEEGGVIFARTAKGSIDRMPAMFGKRQAANLFSRIAKGRLDRMPLTFGKRKGYEATDSRVDNNEDGFFERVTKGSLARMPMSFGKRNSAEYQNFINALRSKLDTLPPKRRDELHERLNKFIDNLKIVHTPLTRLQRSRLERMPLTFGKRGESAISLTESPSQSNDITNNLSHLDSLRPDFMWNTQKRLRVDRMPVAFGKRSSLEGRSLEDVILGSERMSSDSINSKSTNSRSDTLEGTYENSRDVDPNLISSTHVR